ncbi:Uncharacterised protein r2_g3954 [Pycnogonum litorale]
MYVPPMLIFPRKRMKDELKVNAPPGTIFACQENGWMNIEIFCQWLEHFIEVIKPSKTNKVLLILDGHVSHTQNIAALERASEVGVIMLSLPPHTTHRIQPLDRSFFKPLNTYYNQAVETWLRTNPGRAVSVYQISELLGKAYGRAATIATSVNGYAKCGLWPVDRYVFDESEFAPATVTDAHTDNSSRPFHVTYIEPSEFAATAIEAGPSGYSNADRIQEARAGATLTDGYPDVCSSHSHVSNTDQREITATIVEASSTISSNMGSIQKAPGPSNDNRAIQFHVENISPLPKLERRVTKNKRNSRCHKAAELKSSPYKRSLKEKQTKTNPMTKKSKAPRKKIKTKKPDESYCKEDSTICLVCGESYDEDWIQCNVCLHWAHEACADVNDSMYYNCDNCH